MALPRRSILLRLATSFNVFLAFLFSILAFVLPLWCTSTNIAARYDSVLTQTDAHFGLWSLCVNFQLNPNVQQSRESSNTGFKNEDLSMQKCYPYYAGTTNEQEILHFIGKNQVIRSISAETVCAKFTRDNDYAAAVFGTMTGVVEADMKVFLSNTCSPKGYTSFGIMITMICLLGFAFIAYGVAQLRFNTKRTLCFAIVRVSLIGAVIACAILTFSIFAQFRPLLKLNSSERGYNASLYCDIIAFTFTISTTCLVEYELLYWKSTVDGQDKEKDALAISTKSQI